MTPLAIAAPPAPLSRPVRALSAAFGAVAAALAAWAKRERERRALLALDDTALKDLGISRAQAAFEHSRPFWRG